MITQILVPKLGMTQSEITLVKWENGHGQPIEKGAPAATIETAKVTYDIEAPASGLLFHLRKVKDKVKIGEAVGVIGESLEEFLQHRGALAEPSTPTEKGLVVDAEEAWGVRLTFEEEPAEKEASAPETLPDLGDRVVFERIPFMGVRRTIADNLVSSLQTGAQLTVVCQADMTELARFRRDLLLDRPDQRITFVDMLVKVLAFTLKEFPLLNSTILGDEIICWGEVHMGVAVALDRGLVVPVVRNADKKGLFSVSREIRKLSEKARSNQLTPEHYQGGTFTLSSGGNVDVDFMTPIINPPQNAILGIGKIGPRPAIYRNQLAVRTMTHLCLTHDHRVIDGVPAARFLGRLKQLVEHPELFETILK